MPDLPVSGASLPQCLRPQPTGASWGFLGVQSSKPQHLELADLHSNAPIPQRGSLRLGETQIFPGLGQVALTGQTNFVGL